MARTWLVTGSSRGLGWALSQEILARGDNLLATARQPEQLDELVNQYGDQIRPFALDVTDPAAARAAVVAAVQAFGKLDVVANNAGYANSSAIEETPDDDFRAQVETNLFGVVNVTRAALPIFRTQRSGHFLQFSSVGGRVGGTPGLGAYQTAKFAVEGFSEVLYNEVKPFGVRVTIIEPGAFRTDWGGSSMRLGQVGEDYQQTVGRLHGLRQEMDGQQAGDPVRAAKVIVDVVALAAPPLRLLLGSDALRLTEQAAQSRAQETTAWADVSRSTDYDGSPDFARTPVAAMLAPRTN
ncbi:SDR family NAD(P)-dependent oxidoreductase [Plantactinospora sp. S1510]|uniref:SDR family NAD(P)-dependent oxidoreductase n=1 Tax=Plantactinospora alkalitolerans TaxID=2789879 RepID=A0ABS0H5F5_9ACTN|nr:oxidoreductase [Plantactinospora alkalitolerans]MBF9133690.1 SDR family NAD(P)-dependent oxidoreductase [Plantactinospora alkalitolerans]